MFHIDCVKDPTWQCLKNTRRHMLFEKSHSRLQLLLHFSVLILGHSGFTFPEFVHLLSWALKIRLWGYWRNLWMIKQEIHYLLYASAKDKLWFVITVYLFMRLMSTRNPTHYQSSIVLCLNQSVMQPNKVFMLPGNGELWLLERAQRGLGTDFILLTYQPIHLQNIF